MCICSLSDIDTSCSKYEIPAEASQLQDEAKLAFKECLGYSGGDAVRFVSLDKEQVAYPGFISMKSKVRFRLRLWQFTKERPVFSPSDDILSRITYLNTQDDPYGGVIISTRGIREDLQLIEDEFYKLVFKVNIGWVNFNFPELSRDVDVVFESDDIEGFRRYFKAFLLNNTY